MPDSTTTAPEKDKEDFRAFTVRVPLSQYIAMSTMARADKMNLNQKVTELLHLGMGKHISLDSALLRLLKDKIAEEEAKPNV